MAVSEQYNLDHRELSTLQYFLRDGKGILTVSEIVGAVLGGRDQPV
jgi:hypothetical protein